MARPILCCLAMLVLPVWATAAETSLASWANDAQTGVLLMRPAPGQPFVPAPLLTTDVDIEVSGPIAHVTVRQSFFNQSSDFAEAFYVFPLPETSAVHGMELMVGERRIVGEIHEKAEAMRVYEEAKREGRRAGLAEQIRPNIFTTSVANIARGEQVDVVIEYTQTLEMDGSRFTLRFPMTLTPRYLPRSGSYHPLDLPISDPASVGQLRSGAGTERGWPGDVSGPVVAPGTLDDQVNRARIAVHVDAGGPLVVLESPSHDIRTSQEGNAERVTLSEQSVAMDRDFLLGWQLAEGGESQAAFFTEVAGGENYGLLLLTPPQIPEPRQLSREIVFIIDTSGSMGGESIRQARSALLDALERLTPGDRFNVIEFDSSFTTLFAEPVSAVPEKVAEASRFVSHLEAGGGTEMLPALAAGLTMPGDPEYLRQVVFITDGAVGNESAILGLLHQRLGDSRLFTIGIGSAPNSYFMRKAAEVGRGTFTYITAADRAHEKMSELFTKLESPLLRDIEVSLPAGVHGELWPRRIPDLYLGEPVLVAMKLDQFPDHLEVSGNAPTHWQTTVSVIDTGGNKGIATVWAQAKIDALMDRIRRGEPESALRPAIVQIALTQKLVSRYTSFVAVDTTPARPPDAPLVSQAAPNLSPHGFAFPATALGLGRLWAYGMLCLLLAFVAWTWPRVVCRRA